MKIRLGLRTGLLILPQDATASPSAPALLLLLRLHLCHLP
jgi:hypothetical protein